MNTIGDTTVFVGTTAGGVTVETRNVAIFLLRDPSANQITRMEIYNLERKREYSSYPVYWMGRAKQRRELELSARACRGIAARPAGRTRGAGNSLHDDARVGGMLKNFVSSSQNQHIRSSSVYCLGRSAANRIFSLRSCATKPKTRNFAVPPRTRLDKAKIAARYSCSLACMNQ
jgi:hypothetical protein